ncbi:MAG: ArsR family transcriptional regulator [Deltaproteobacteria bacterium]|nr:ArsR family transcriptional regulator [Deltaproteobacteria bacterium]
MLQIVSENKAVTPEYEKALDTFIQAAGKISANMLGMVSKVGGQIYALLFLSSKPLSLDEIADHLKTSKSNVSINIRLLEKCKLVQKVWVKGTRKDYYEAKREYPKQVFRDFFDRLRTGVDESIRIINKCKNLFQKIENSKATAPEDLSFLLNQLKILSTFYEGASRVFENFYQGKSVDIELIRKIIFED